jgi:hypothetical protein
MRRWSPRLWLAGLLFLAGYLSLAQPGLCPYWLVGDVSALAADVAGHDPDEPQPHHDHNQQRDYFLATTAPALPQPVLAVASLLAALAAGALVVSLAECGLQAAAGHPLRLTPPPRG